MDYPKINKKRQDLRKKISSLKLEIYNVLVKNKDLDYIIVSSALSEILNGLNEDQIKDMFKEDDNE